MEMIKMNGDKNTEIKNALMEALKEGTFIFKRASYTPFIGDDYDSESEKILYIGDSKIPKDNAFIKETKNRKYPTENYCTQIMSYCNDENLGGGEQKSKEVRLGKKQLEKLKKHIDGRIQSVAYYNFYYDRFDGKKIPNQGLSGKELKIYLRAFRFVVEILKPQKIIFWGNTIVNRLKKSNIRPDAFKGKNLEEWLEFMGIREERIPLKGNLDSPASNNVVLKGCIDNLRMILREFGNIFNDSWTDNERIRALNRMPYDKIDPFDSAFEEVSKSLNSDEMGFAFMCMKTLRKTERDLISLREKIDGKKVYQTESELKKEKDIRLYKWMSRLLEECDVYVPTTLIPLLLDYIENQENLDDEMLFEDEAVLSVDDFNTYSAEWRSTLDDSKKQRINATGEHNNVLAIYKYLKNSNERDDKDDAEIMEKRIFVPTKKNKYDFTKLIIQKQFEIFLDDGSIEIWRPNDFSHYRKMLSLLEENNMCVSTITIPSLLDYINNNEKKNKETKYGEVELSIDCFSNNEKEKSESTLKHKSLQCVYDFFEKKNEKKFADIMKKRIFERPKSKKSVFVKELIPFQKMKKLLEEGSIKKWSPIK